MLKALVLRLQLRIFHEAYSSTCLLDLHSLGFADTNHMSGYIRTSLGVALSSQT